MGREVLEGIQTQGADETITYTVTVSPAPTSIIGVDVFDERTDLSVQPTVMPTGQASFVGSVITCPPLTALVVGKGYRVEVKYTEGTNIIECYFRVYCE